MSAIDNTKKSARFLQSRRYTHDTYTDAQEAFTSVLDINADEVYIDQGLIPSSGLPYNSSGNHLSVYSASGQEVMKYYYRYKMTKSDLNNEVWFFLVPTGSTSGIGAQIIDGGQQTNFISPKYSIPSLANANTEDATTGYGVKVFVSTNATTPASGDQVSVNNYTFDYKTGVLQFTTSAVAPSASQYVYISAYQYVGRKLSSQITNGGTVYDILKPTGSVFATTNDLEVTGSLIVTDGISGSFTGDGTGLYNVPASGVTGLNLSQIADGSATASISNSEGLRVNRNTEITGSLIVTSGSAVFNSQVTAESSNLILTSGSSLYVKDGGEFNITGSSVLSGSVTIKGDLRVEGTTTLVQTDNPNVESLIVSGAMSIVKNQINSQIISASLSIQSLGSLSDLNSNAVIDLGGF
jgi:hypothetical protein